MQISDYALIATLHLMTVASPGPATLAIAATSAERGRAAGLALAFGVMGGMMTWAVAGGFGMGAVMAAHAWTAEALRIVGGLYLLYIAWKSTRAALRGGPAPEGRSRAGGLRVQALKGLGIHLTNPKAILFWSSIFAAVGPAVKTPGEIASILAMCLCIALAVFPGYALLFSTRAAMRGWARAHRPLSAAMGALFGAAGAALLLNRAGSAP